MPLEQETDDVTNPERRRFQQGLHWKRVRAATWLVALGFFGLTVAILISIRGQASVTSAQTVHGAGDALHQGGVLAELPDITLMSVDGREVSLKELEGEAVLVNFWATWCPPCRQEMSSLQEFHQLYQDEGVVVVAINAGESAAQVNQFANEYGLTFDVLLDPSMQSMGEFHVTLLPTSFFIDRDGNISGQQMGQLVKSQIEALMLPLK